MTDDLARRVAHATLTKGWTHIPVRPDESSADNPFTRPPRSTKPTLADLAWYFRTSRDMTPELAADHFRQHWPDAVREEDVT